MFDIDFDEMGLGWINRQPSYKELKAELQVYRDMQDNLNSNLTEHPAILDYLETLQCSVIPLDEIALPFQLEEKYRDKYHVLKSENKMLKEHIGLQHVRLGKDVVNLNGYARKLAVCKATMEAYQHNCNLWKAAYDKLKQEQTN